MSTRDLLPNWSVNYPQITSYSSALRSREQPRAHEKFDLNVEKVVKEREVIDDQKPIDIFRFKFYFSKVVDLTYQVS